MNIEIGSRAPDFTLNSNHLKPVTLSSFAGDKNVLLVYYPRAFTPICRGELCQLRDEVEIYHKYDVQVIGVSVDSPFCLKAWADTQGYPFPLLSDFWPHGEVAETYGSFDDALGVARRGTFLIDTEGIIRFAKVQEEDVARDQSEWKSQVASMLGSHGRDLSEVAVPAAPGNWITLHGEG
ncbi:Peroxiredoxin [Amycolatopsis lurida]|uniref:Alkyl hydroperoxide reductase E n=1 Tax=Amycolatopsis lurida NRRL 2430 TaxID=1460371 RepID=A0A2P2FG09_AMYLU|nr:peroxiredoxin [Amycolatopsis lurida NRRL 2430]SEE31168.1 Peroxiredoxin [Amycolatopsis lurida]